MTPEDVQRIQTLSLLLNASSTRPSFKALDDYAMAHGMHMGIRSVITGPADMFHLDTLEAILPTIAATTREDDTIRSHIRLLDGRLQAKCGKGALTCEELVTEVGKIRLKAVEAAGVIAKDVYSKMGRDNVRIQKPTAWMLLLREMDCKKGQRQPVHMDCKWPRLVLNIYTNVSTKHTSPDEHNDMPIQLTEVRSRMARNRPWLHETSMGDEEPWSTLPVLKPTEVAGPFAACMFFANVPHGMPPPPTAAPSTLQRVTLFTYLEPTGVDWSLVEVNAAGEQVDLQVWETTGLCDYLTEAPTPHVKKRVHRRLYQTVYALGGLAWLEGPFSDCINQSHRDLMRSILRNPTEEELRWTATGDAAMRRKLHAPPGLHQ